MTICSINLGSSPRLRGTRGKRKALVGFPRFIPAFAGNTTSANSRSGVTAVHPRVCGEHGFLPSAIHLRTGSSPRLRGTRDRLPEFQIHVRFIPAFAGNTLSSRRRSSVRAVHPRVCGEHPNPCRVFPHYFGSSPRLRGTRASRPKLAANARFIPAFAGNTPGDPPRTTKKPVHPRVCGEHAALVNVIVPAGGSSPRLRGTHATLTLQSESDRFIPAFAGNTSSSNL